MYRVATIVLALCASFSSFAEDHANICGEVKEFAAVTSQFPDYTALPDTSAKWLSGKITGIRAQPEGTSACVALVVNETGIVQDVVAYYPQPLALSKRERKSFLTHRFSPALIGGNPVKSITWVRVDKSKGFIRR